MEDEGGNGMRKEEGIELCYGKWSCLLQNNKLDPLIRETMHFALRMAFSEKADVDLTELAFCSVKFSDDAFNAHYALSQVHKGLRHVQVAVRVSIKETERGAERVGARDILYTNSCASNLSSLISRDEYF